MTGAQVGDPVARSPTAIAAPLQRVHRAAMRLNASHMWRGRRWKTGSFREHRELELRMTVGRAVRRLRRERAVTQAELANWMNCATSTISKLELARPGVTFDIAIRALFALDAADDQVASAFNVTSHPMIDWIRHRDRNKNNLPEEVIRPRYSPWWVEPKQHISRARRRKRRDFRDARSGR